MLCFILLTVPILPSYLHKIDQATTTSGNNTDSTIGPPIVQQLSNKSGVLDSTCAPPNQNPALSSNATVAKNPPYSNCSRADVQLDKVSIKVGLLLASKSTMQLIINPFIGLLTNRWVTLIYLKQADIYQAQKHMTQFSLHVSHRIGYHVPMCAGFCIIIIATTCKYHIKAFRQQLSIAVPYFI